MKRKCPNCKSTKTAEMLIYRRNKESGMIEFPPGPTMWVCDECDHSWEPGRRKATTSADGQEGGQT